MCTTAVEEADPQVTTADKAFMVERAVRAAAVPEHRESDLFLSSAQVERQTLAAEAAPERKRVAVTVELAVVA